MNPELLTDQELTDLLKESEENQNRIYSSSKFLTDSQKAEWSVYARIEFVCQQEQKRRLHLKAKERLEYLRSEIQAERISHGEIAELWSLAQYIEPGDVELLQWAGVPEFSEEE